MADNLNSQVSALVKYLNDVKPYHTKLLSFTSGIEFNETLSLGFAEAPLQHVITHKNIWGSDDIASLAIVSDGSEASRTFVLPPTVMPRFSVTDSVNYQQSPIGDDQALNDLTDTGDGVPDASYPWPGQPSPSHQLGSDIIPVQLTILSLQVNVTAATATTFTATVDGVVSTAYPDICGITLSSLTLRHRDGSLISSTVSALGGPFSVTFSGTYPTFMANEPTLPAISDVKKATAYLIRMGFVLEATADTGRYAVPFHTAARVRVNNVVKVFSTEWLVDLSRSFVQFTAGNHPAPTDLIDINLMSSDRLFISICDPFVQGVQGYDMVGYDDAPYDADPQADYFLLTVSNSEPNRYISTFVDLETGKNKARLEDVLIYPSEADGNLWQIVATGLFSASVQQVHPITGPIEQAIINEPFDNGKIAFTLRPSWVEYYFTHDTGSYVAYDMLPYDLGEPLDEADFWPSVELKTEHGKVIDPQPPLHGPVQFNPFGELKQREVNGAPQYIFVLATAPSAGSFVELRVEQAKQLNPRLQLSMHEHLRIVQVAGDGPSDVALFDSDIVPDHEMGITT